MLACGEDTVLRFNSALALRGRGHWPETPQVSTPKRRRGPHITTHDRDVAPSRSDRELVRLINDTRIARE